MPDEYCAPYFLIGGGLIPLVNEAVEPISKCKVEVECFYAGIIVVRIDWPTHVWVESLEEEYSFIATNKECCK